MRRIRYQSEGFAAYLQLTYTLRPGFTAVFRAGIGVNALHTVDPGQQHLRRHSNIPERLAVEAIEQRDQSVRGFSEVELHLVGGQPDRFFHKRLMLTLEHFKVDVGLPAEQRHKEAAGDRKHRDTQTVDCGLGANPTFSLSARLG